MNQLWLRFDRKFGGAYELFFGSTYLRRLSRDDAREILHLVQA